MFPTSARGPVYLVVAASMVLGCSRGQSAEDRQLSELRDELARVQSESDKFEQRLDKLEVDSNDARPPPSLPARSTAAPIATPSLRVVRLGPDGLEESSPPAETAASLEAADPADTTPRPHIKIQGTGGDTTVTSGKGKPRRIKNDRIEESGAADQGSSYGASSVPSALDPEAKRAYDAALALVNAKKYPQALEALAGFLVKYPDHPNADNAMFWRGECYFAQGQYAQAVEQFEGVIARFPLGNKLPDAVLKLGLSRQHLGDAAGARAQFDRLRREFPHADATRRIPEGGGSRANSGENP
ncbi:MAG TPA: tol-pal system protein YbgF [Polyangiaceae bacterium]|jgi:tol-pal system protein YbgF